MDERSVDHAVRGPGAGDEAVDVGELAPMRLGAHPRERVDASVAARQSRDLVPRVQQFRHNRRPHEARGSRQKNTHDVILLLEWVSENNPIRLVSREQYVIDPPFHPVVLRRARSHARPSPPARGGADAGSSLDRHFRRRGLRGDEAARRRGAAQGIRPRAGGKPADPPALRDHRRRTARPCGAAARGAE